MNCFENENENENESPKSHLFPSVLSVVIYSKVSAALRETLIFQQEEEGD
jgi:hypothetical protein